MKKLNALLLLVLLSGMAGGQNTGEGSRGGGLAAMSEGGGLVKLFWFPVPGQWPAGGFRLLDAAGKVLADRLIPGVDTEALNSLSAEDRTLLADLSRKLASAKSPADIRSAYGVLAVKAASDRRFAKAAGLAADLAGQPGGLRVYSVVPLDANGRGLRLLFRSAASRAFMASGSSGKSPLTGTKATWSGTPSSGSPRDRPRSPCCPARCS
jgi:hypothetical protein